VSGLRQLPNPDALSASANVEAESFHSSPSSPLPKRVIAPTSYDSPAAETLLHCPASSPPGESRVLSPILSPLLSPSCSPISSPRSTIARTSSACTSSNSRRVVVGASGSSCSSADIELESGPSPGSKRASERSEDEGDYGDSDSDGSTTRAGRGRAVARRSLALGEPSSTGGQNNGSNSSSSSSSSSASRAMSPHLLDLTVEPWGQGNGHKKMAARPPQPPQETGWAKLCRVDGDGCLLREVLSFFVASLQEPPVPHAAKRRASWGQGPNGFGGGVAPFVGVNAAKDCVGLKDLLAASCASRFLAAACDQALSGLLLPGKDGPVAFKPKALALPRVPDAHPALTGAAEGAAEPPSLAASRVPLVKAPQYRSLMGTASITSSGSSGSNSDVQEDKQQLLVPRPSLGTFVAMPERRIRAFTACDVVGRAALDELYGNPVFCVRYRGIRRGGTLFPAGDSAGQPGWARSSGVATGAWPLQLHTYFKMRTYTKFERLMSVYAGRSHLPLPWLSFEVTDRLYGQPTTTNNTSGSSSSSASGFSSSSSEAGSAVIEGTNNGRLPLLPPGGQIMAGHSLWTIGIEPGLDGLLGQEATAEDEEGGEAATGGEGASPALPEAGNGMADDNNDDDEEDSDDSSDENSDEEQADENNLMVDNDQAATAAPIPDAGPATALAAAAIAAEAAAAAEAEAEAEDEEEPVSSIEDVWVDSYLCCEADEVFVCVRDCRTTAEVPSASTQALTRCGTDVGEGALLGNGAQSGSQGMAGRFAAGDSGSDLPAATNDADPGQPVRPPHRGWLFKVPQDASLQGVMDRVRSELMPSSEPIPTTGTMGDDSASSIHEAESLTSTSSSSSNAPLLPAQPQPAAQWEVDDDLLSPPNQLLHFVAVAPHFHAAPTFSYVQGGISNSGGSLPRGASNGCTSLRSNDTPTSATLRAAFGKGPHPLQRVAAVDSCAPLHILEVHDLQSYITSVWARK